MTFDVRDLEMVSRRFDLLKHSFYQRWVAGELTHDELDDYAGQYAHVVVGLPRWLEAAADHDPSNAERLRAHAREEATHVGLWDMFTRAIGPGRDDAVDEPNPATRELIRRCDELAAAGHGAAVAWAVEAQSPAVSASKLDGLRAHYGIDARSGGEYFALHATRDIEHREELADVIARGADNGVARAAEAALSGMWDLLTSVERPASTI